MANKQRDQRDPQRAQARDPALDSAKDSAKQAAQAAGEAARAKAQTLFDTNKEAALTNATVFAGVLRSASSELEGQQDSMARWARRAADNIEGACRGLENRDLNATLQAIENYARRESAMFLGGAFVAGVAAARFLKASGERRRSAGGAHEFSSFSSTRPGREAAPAVEPSH